MILVCFGTRPEWLKIKPLLNNLYYKLLFTGQHVDLLDEIDFDYSIEQEEGITHRLDAIVSKCLLNFPRDSECDSVLVQGDTASAFACALGGFHRKMRVIHLEAGLRTHNLNHPYPEEGYRQMISRITNIHLCPTELSKENLIREGCEGDMHVVGNTVLDNIKSFKDNSYYGDKVLVTLHRRENHYQMGKWFRAVEEVAEAHPHLEFILPIHPNPEVIKHKKLLKKVTVVSPLDHRDLIKLLCECLLVITDSGGIQEEASFLNKKSIVCREVTERSEGIGSGHLIMCASPNELLNCFESVAKNPIIDRKCPFGDGNSVDKILEIL